MNPYDEYKAISECSLVDQMFHEALHMEFAQFVQVVADDKVFRAKLMDKFHLSSLAELIEFVREHQSEKKMPKKYRNLVNPMLMHCQNRNPLRVPECPHILCPYNGDFIMRIGSETVPLPYGKLIIVAQNVTHTVAPAGNSGNYMLMHCLPGQDFHDPVLDRLDASDPLKKLLLPGQADSAPLDRPYLLFDTGSNTNIVHFMACAILEYNKNAAFSMEAAGSYMTLLFLELLKIQSDSHRDNDPNRAVSDDFSEMIINYIDRNIETASLPSMAEHFHFHPNYLSRLIRESTGHTFSELVQLIRLRNAATMLLRTNKSVTEIASDVGYRNSSFFYKKFHERYGCSPTEYRAAKHVIPYT